jgi:hypothetical protein
MLGTTKETIISIQTCVLLMDRRQILIYFFEISVKSRASKNRTGVRRVMRAENSLVHHDKSIKTGSVPTPICDVPPNAIGPIFFDQFFCQKIRTVKGKYVASR